MGYVGLNVLSMKFTFFTGERGSSPPDDVLSVRLVIERCMYVSVPSNACLTDPTIRSDSRRLMEREVVIKAWYEFSNLFVSIR